MAKLIEKWKQKAKQLKIEIYAMYLAYKDPRVPWYARIFAACVVGYAFSPIDLIPDPIPILGYFDDLILILVAIPQCSTRLYWPRIEIMIILILINNEFHRAQIFSGAVIQREINHGISQTRLYH